MRKVVKFIKKSGSYKRGLTGVCRKFAELRSRLKSKNGLYAEPNCGGERPPTQGMGKLGIALKNSD
jgi:hypothetical protein